MTSSNQTTSPEKVETLAPGILLQRRFDGRMLVFTATTAITRQMVDVWFAELQLYAAEHNTRFLVYDASRVSLMSFTPYSRQRLLDVAHQFPNAEGRVAVIIPKLGPLRSLVEYFVRRSSNRLQPKLDIRLFNQRKSGIEWVIDGMKN